MKENKLTKALRRCIRAEQNCKRSDIQDQNSEAVMWHEGAIAAFEFCLKYVTGQIPDADDEELDLPLAGPC